MDSLKYYDLQLHYDFTEEIIKIALSSNDDKK